jgi:hypothetical protein
MSEPQQSAAAQPRQDEAGAMQAWLESLRREGAWRLDPARFHALEALSRRLPGQPEPVRLLLQEKLQAAVAAYAGRFAERRQAEGEVPGIRRLAAQAPAAAPRSALAQLNKYIRGATPAGLGAAAPGETQGRDELASVQRFRRAWSSSRSQQQVEQAAARKPANAGPLNSHALVLQSLDLMRALSPDYLRRFLVHLESLQWLEMAGQHYPPPETTQAKKTKTKAMTPAQRGRYKK